MSLACRHLHQASFLPPDCSLWMWQKDATHPAPHIPFLNTSVQDLSWVTPSAFCLIWLFVMDISSIPLVFAPDPFQTFLGELSPCSCGHQQSPWGLSYQRQPSLHITQLTRQQPAPGSSQGSGQPWVKPPAIHWLDHLAVVSQGWRPQCHHLSVLKWQGILKAFLRP